MIDAGNPNGFYTDSDGTRNDIGNMVRIIFVTQEVVDFGNVMSSSCCISTYIDNFDDVQNLSSCYGI